MPHKHASITALALLSAAACTIAGPLDPPAGPIAPTHKTLAQVEPRTPISLATTPGDSDSVFKITQPGSYYLTANVIGVAKKHGIEVAASGVFIDLSGFELTGAPGSLDGVTASVANLSSISVHDGTIRAWGGSGIDVNTLPARSCIFRNLSISNNGGSGMRVGGAAVVTDCVGRSNGDTGIQGADACTITNCTFSQSVGTAILVTSGATITGCTVHSHLRDGIDAGSRSTVTACSVYGVSQYGIVGDFGTTIADCIVTDYGVVGIRVNHRCVVLNNQCVGFIFTGIEVLSSDNRIDGNGCMLANSGYGVRVLTNGNFIVRNSVSGADVNWSLVAGNVHGPIIDRTNPASPAVNGNDAPDASGTTHPNANFSY